MRDFRLAMAALRILVIFIVCAALGACEESTGYYDESQKDILYRLTDKEWFMYYAHTPGFQSESFENEGWIYVFDSDGRGKRTWWKKGTEENTGTEYFQWTFTTDNFAVIYLGGNIERFWLIDRLTDTELIVQDAIQDPVLHPGTYKQLYKFRPAQ